MPVEGISETDKHGKSLSRLFQFKFKLDRLKVVKFRCLASDPCKIIKDFPSFPSFQVPSLVCSSSRSQLSCMSSCLDTFVMHKLTYVSKNVLSSVKF